jgi:hypothetical protein
VLPAVADSDGDTGDSARPDIHSQPAVVTDDAIAGELVVTDWDGNENGLERYVDDGEVGGIPGGGGFEPTEPIPEDPEIVPYSALHELRIATDVFDLPTDATKLSIRRDGKARVVATFQLCLSKDGTAVRVGRMKSSGYVDYDNALQTAMRDWRFMPYNVDGKARRACAAVMFVYTQTS